MSDNFSASNNLDDYDDYVEVQQKSDKMGHSNDTRNKGSHKDQKVVQKYTKLKEEMQTLYLNSDIQKQIMDTLRYIHGPQFELSSVTDYKKKKSGLNDQFWVDGGNLVVKSAWDYSDAAKSVLTAEDKLRQFSVQKLSSYGFYESHCQEALIYCKDDIDKTLVLLYEKYHQNLTTFEVENKEILQAESLQHRDDEKNVLESIYDTTFSERQPNLLWILTFELPYLVEMFDKTQIDNTPKVKIDKSKLCRNFERNGQCPYGANCRFIHQETQAKRVMNEKVHYTFELEIRFKNDTIYPFETPTILLKTNFDKMPKITLVYICERLLDEANNLAENGIVSVYSICELLLNGEEIQRYLRQTTVRYIDETDLLFPVVQRAPSIDKELPSHYQKRITTNKKANLNMESILKQNETLVKDHYGKVSQSRYQKMISQRKTLPAWAKQNDIINTIKSSQIIIICGDTGCGKSTQVPQYILDDWLVAGNGKEPLNVVCTQPRRLSAVGVAERIAAERIESIGHSIGYQIRLQTKCSKYTRCTFMTIGILLQRLQTEATLESITHIIVDEVHERSDENDFLLLILRQLLPQRPDLKIILMSATLNAQLFNNYFGGKVPILTIPGRTFPVHDYFIEDMYEMTKYVLEESGPFTRTDISSRELTKQLATADVATTSRELTEHTPDAKLPLNYIYKRYKKYSDLTCKNIYLSSGSNKINYELIEHILEWIVIGDHDHPKDGTVLIFLPGHAEISTMIQQLNNNRLFKNPNAFIILPLHSTLSNEEQNAIFRKYDNGIRKIIVSTNIAETSITIDDCIFVIDSGRMKEKHFDCNKNMESLDTVWVTRAAALQRKGRAGRVTSGVCVHLYTEYQYKQFEKQPIPELHRIPLEQIILRIKILPNFLSQKIHRVIGDTIEPPSREHIESSIVRLQNIGALDESQDLTALGHHLAKLPVDVRIGKLMLFGAIFACLDSSLTIAAILSYKSPFKAKTFGKNNGEDSTKNQFLFANSDQMTMLRAYQKWRSVADRNTKASYNFAFDNNLSYHTLTTITDIKHQLLDLLINIGFVPDITSTSVRKNNGRDNVIEMTGDEMNTNGLNHKLLAGIICAALYPNIVKILTPSKVYEKCIGGVLPTTPQLSQIKLITIDDNSRAPVAIHPSSVNAKLNGALQSKYLVYQEKVKTSRVFVRETCMITPLSLALFASADLHIQVLESNVSIISLDSLIFRTETHEVAEMLKAIRIQLNKILELKINDPSLNLLHHKEGKKVIQTIIDVITN